MKALVCEAPLRITLAKRAEPVRPENWVRVTPSYVGGCGTDYHIYEGLHPFLSYPLVIGHEVAGTASEATSGGKLREGQRIVVNPYLSCGHCRACRVNKPNCCMAIKVLGVHTEGAMAGSIVAPAANRCPADDLPLRDAAMVEFPAIGAHAARRGAVAASARVAVVGAGPIGFGIALFARVLDAHVTLIDLRAARLPFAASVLDGAQSLLAGDSLREAVVTATGCGGFDVVFDATGDRASMENGLHLVGEVGSYVFVSAGKDNISLADPLFHSREMTLLGSRNATSEDFTTVMTAMREGRVPTARLNTHTAELSDAADAIPSWLKTPDQVFKAIVRVGD